MEAWVDARLHRYQQPPTGDLMVDVLSVLARLQDDLARLTPQAGVIAAHTLRQHVPWIRYGQVPLALYRAACDLEAIVGWGATRRKEDAAPLRLEDVQAWQHQQALRARESSSSSPPPSPTGKPLVMYSSSDDDDDVNYGKPLVMYSSSDDDDDVNDGKPLVMYSSSDDDDDDKDSGKKDVLPPVVAPLPASAPSAAAAVPPRSPAPLDPNLLSPRGKAWLRRWMDTVDASRVDRDAYLRSGLRTLAALKAQGLYAPPQDAVVEALVVTEPSKKAVRPRSRNLPRSWRAAAQELRQVAPLMARHGLRLGPVRGDKADWDVYPYYVAVYRGRNRLAIFQWNDRRSTPSYIKRIKELIEAVKSRSKSQSQSQSQSQSKRKRKPKPPVPKGHCRYGRKITGRRGCKKKPGPKRSRSQSRRSRK